MEFRAGFQENEMRSVHDICIRAAGSDRDGLAYHAIYWRHLSRVQFGMSFQIRQVISYWGTALFEFTMGIHIEIGRFVEGNVFQMDVILVNCIAICILYHGNSANEKHTLKYIKHTPLIPTHPITMTS